MGLFDEFYYGVLIAVFAGLVCYVFLPRWDRFLDRRFGKRDSSVRRP